MSGFGTAASGPERCAKARVHGPARTTGGGGGGAKLGRDQTILIWVCLPSMMIRLIYVSKAVDQQTPKSSESILRTSQAWNAQNDLTGVLCQGQGMFLQVLEGERGKVTSLYARIHADPRHKDLELIHCESIATRRYEAWSMANVRLSEVDPQSRIVWPDFDPYSPSGQLVMARIDELIAQGRVVGAPLP